MFLSLYLVFLLYYAMILQRIRIIVGDVKFEPRTSTPEVWCTTNEPPHLKRATTSPFMIYVGMLLLYSQTKGVKPKYLLNISV